MAASKTRDERGVKKQAYRRFKEGVDYDPTDEQETAVLCNMFLKGFLGIEETEEGEEVRRKPGRPRKYETLGEFMQAAENYIKYIKEQAADGVQLIPDIEGFCSFIGISRDTLNDWERTRPGEYSDAIKSFKTGIAAYKKQLAYKNKIPALVFATDFNNNHGYIQQTKLEIQAGRKLDALPEKADILQRLPKNNAGLIGMDEDISINIDDV